MPAPRSEIYGYHERQQPVESTITPCILIVSGLKVLSALQMPWTLSIKFPCLGGIVEYLVAMKHYTGEIKNPLKMPVFCEKRHLEG
jgi:hypothetical protein